MAIGLGTENLQSTFETQNIFRLEFCSGNMSIWQTPCIQLEHILPFTTVTMNASIM